MLLNFSQMEVFSYKFGILDDNFLTIIKVDFSDNFSAAENVAGEKYRLTNTKINSAVRHSRVGKSSAGVSGWGKAKHVHLCRVAANTVISYGR